MPTPGVTAAGGASPGNAADVALVHWPAGDEERRHRARQGLATLLVLPPRALPPDAWGPLEDWLREPLDPVEVYSRRERLRRRLAARAPATLDEDGLLRRGRRWVALAPNEARLVRALLADAGSLVSRDRLVAAIRPATGEDRHRALDGVVRRTRDRVGPLALAIHTVRGCGYMLEAHEMGVDPTG